MAGGADAARGGTVGVIMAGPGGRTAEGLEIKLAAGEAPSVAVSCTSALN